MYIALLGRQPELSIAELERLFGDVSWFSGISALVKTDTAPNIQRIGGTQKFGKVAFTVPSTDWRRVSDAIVKHYGGAWQSYEGKITLGLSAYDFKISPRELQKTGLIIKSKLKQAGHSGGASKSGKSSQASQPGASIRLIPNQELALSTATSHHNKLGLSPNKIELLIIRGKTTTIVAESTGAQNITALAARDQGRPRRDAFVGMLPPKLAQMMINMAVGGNALAQAISGAAATPRILDPFCGTGVILQEAALMGYSVYGTDLSEKMIRYSRDNLNWLEEKYGHGSAHNNHSIDWYLHEGDAMDAVWQQPITAVAAETYLGQPFSAPPSAAKLTEVRGNCNHIIGSFLRNLSAQLQPGTTIAIAVPAWRDKEGDFTHLPLISTPENYGFSVVDLKTARPDQLLYFRPDQVVAREILILVKQ